MCMQIVCFCRYILIVRLWFNLSDFWGVSHCSGILSCETQFLDDRMVHVDTGISGLAHSQGINLQIHLVIKLNSAWKNATVQWLSHWLPFGGRERFSFWSARREVLAKKIGYIEKYHSWGRHIDLIRRSSWPKFSWATIDCDWYTLQFTKRRRVL